MNVYDRVNEKIIIIKKNIYIYIWEVCKSIFAWNSAQYVESEQNKYYERKKRTQLHFPFWEM